MLAISLAIQLLCLAVSTWPRLAAILRRPKPGRWHSSAARSRAGRGRTTAISCHNNGDAARGALPGRPGGSSRSREMRWPIRPAGSPARGLGPQRRRRPVQRQAAGARGLHGGARDRGLDRVGQGPIGPARGRADRLALDQAADGPGRSRERTRPARRRPTAERWPRSWRARACRGRARPVPRRHRSCRRLAAEPRGPHRDRRLGEPAGVLACAVAGSGRRDARRCFDLLAAASPTTAAGGRRSPRLPSRSTRRWSLLALAKCETTGRGPRHDRPRPRFLIAEQRGRRELDRDDPAGRQRQLRQRISTAGWATLALLRNRPAPSRSGRDPKR